MISMPHKEPPAGRVQDAESRDYYQMFDARWEDMKKYKKEYLKVVQRQMFQHGHQMFIQNVETEVEEMFWGDPNVHILHDSFAAKYVAGFEVSKSHRHAFGQDRSRPWTTQARWLLLTGPRPLRCAGDLGPFLWEPELRAVPPIGTQHQAVRREAQEREKLDQSGRSQSAALCNRSRASPVAHAARLRALSPLPLSAPREHLRMRAALHAAPTAPLISPREPRSTDMALDPNGRLMQMFGSAAQSIPQVKQTRARCTASRVQLCPSSLGLLRAARPCYLTRARATRTQSRRTRVACIMPERCRSRECMCACDVRAECACGTGAHLSAQPRPRLLRLRVL
jgi:hypothetical protein